MCLAIPGRIVEIDHADACAVIDYDGIRKHASLMLWPSAKIGDMVLVHAGFVIQKIDDTAAKEINQVVKDVYFDENHTGK